MTEAQQDQAAYKGMLKATSTLAGAKVVTIIISIIKTKVLAILLGPSGMGMVNLVSTSSNLVRVAFAFGLDGATARKVAEVSTEKDPKQIDHTYRVSARTAIGAGVISAILLSLLSPFLSIHFFGNTGRFWWFCFGAASLVFTPMLGIQLSFLQGLRQTRALAICQILASFFAALVNIVLVIFFGVIGGIVALMTFTLISLSIHHKYLKLYRPKVDVTVIPAKLEDTKRLLKLGSGFAVNAIWLAGSGWLNLFFISRFFGTEEAPLQIGLYGAAATMSNLYIGILVSAMATEFYPQLVQAAQDRRLMNRLLNQQTMLALTLGVPATMSMIALSPWLLGLLYSPEFAPGAELMRWLLVGMAIRFASCPLGFSLLATGSPRTIMISELIFGAVTISSSYLLLQFYGLKGIGVAVTSSNLLYLFGIILVTRRLGVCWNPHSFLLMAETLIVLALCLATSLLLPVWWGVAIGLGLVAIYFAHLAFLIRKDSGIDLSHLFKKIRNFIPRKNA